jgi:hypothetical protein
VDVFFNESAPEFTENQAYWTEDGTPPPVTEDCSAGTSGDPARDRAVENRTFRVCDVQDSTPYHAHDGSQTFRPT